MISRFTERRENCGVPSWPSVHGRNDLIAKGDHGGLG